MDELRSGNISLRDFSRADASSIFTIISKPDFHFSDMGTTYSEAEAFVQKCIERSAIRDENGLKISFRKAIVHQKHGLIGYVGLGMYKPPLWMEDGYELGAFVDRDYDGKGHGIRACRILLDHAISLGIRKFYGTASPDNDVSIRAQKFLGFDFVRNLNADEITHYNNQPRMLFRLHHDQ